MYDNNLFFRTAGAGTLSATETSAAVDIGIGGTPAIGLALVIDIPKKDIGDTMQVTLQHSTDNSTYTNLVTIETVASITATSTVPTKIVRRFHTRNRYLKTVTTVAGTSPDFGAVVMRLGAADEWNVLKIGAVTANP